ncbi:hypothetical protein CSC82_04860 [Rhodobacteraceae bacterium 4F10]|nr:hypothetical protein CSC82_04860 [Rhodobacteraceae bacterium 4F10]
MKSTQNSAVTSIGDVKLDTDGDMVFPRKSGRSGANVKTAQLSPSRRRAAARTKTLSVSVNPDLYAVWDNLRENEEQSVVRAVELSLIAFLAQNGVEFDL